MSFEDFQNGQHGDHLGYRYGMILTILNHQLAPMPSTKFWLNLTLKVPEQMWFQDGTQAGILYSQT